MAGDNPWGEGATTLEWTLPSPPPFHQFETLPRIRLAARTIELRRPHDGRPCASESRDRVLPEPSSEGSSKDLDEAGSPACDRKALTDTACP